MDNRLFISFSFVIMTKFIPPSRKKQVQPFFVALILTFLFWGVARWFYETQNRIYVWLWIFTLVSFCFLGYVAIDFLFTSSEKRGLHLDKDGLLFQQTSLGRKIGKILRKDVADIKLKKNKLWIKAVFLLLKDPKHYLTQFSLSKEIKNMVFEEGFPVSDSELDISLEELFEQIQSYFHQAH